MGSVFAHLRTGWSGFWLALEIAAILGLTAIAAASFVLWRSGHLDLPAYARVALDPSIASVLLVLACIVYPALLSSAKLRFPLNVTMPAVFLGLMMTYKILSDDGSGHVHRMGQPARYDLMWYQPVMLGNVFLLGTLALTITLVVSKRHRDGADERIQ